MRLAILCFAFGVFCLQWQEVVPSRLFLFGMASVALLVGIRVWHRKGSRYLGWPVAFVFGLVWAGWMVQARLEQRLDPVLEGRDIQVVGVISGLPVRTENGWRFPFRVEQAQDGLPETLSLSWYQRRASSHQDETLGFQGDLPDLHAGQRWCLTVRLKRPHGNVNPHGFDYEAWLLAQDIRATGYVRPSAAVRLLEDFVFRPENVVAHLRERIRDRFEQQLAGRTYAGVLIALVIGDQRAIDARQWQLFSRTGITHLVSISGLHVTMLAALTYGLVNFFWRRWPVLMLRCPAQRAAALGGFLAALAYCLLAGFAVPAQRTLYMLAVVALALWRGRMTSVSRVWLLALLLVLLLDPWAVLAPGFWLSFGAVGLLFYVATGRVGREHWLREWGRTQWAVTLGSIPLLLLLFQQFSLVSPLANAIAIPVVSFVVTPLALAAALPPLSFLLWPAHWVLEALMHLMAELAYWPWAIWQQAVPPTWLWLAGWVGCLWLLLPRGFPARWLGAVSLLSLLAYTPERPEEGAARLTVLDVGQGLAVHVQTARHDLLYDTGPLYTAEADAGNRVLLPYLRAVGVPALTGVVVTHRDTDHSGGAESLIDGMPVGWLMSSLEFEHVLSALPVKSLRCEAGQSWNWDGVQFTILHPTAAQYAQTVHKTNEMSCVMRVSTGGGSVLLTADIEVASEAAILSRLESAGQSEQLRSTVLLAPHHGSRTSSSAEFIRAVAAKAVIFPVGYRNAFGHPRADVVERYRTTGAALRRTDVEGALRIDLPTHVDKGEVSVTSERARHPRYWYGQ